MHQCFIHTFICIFTSILILVCQLFGERLCSLDRWLKHFFHHLRGKIRKRGENAIKGRAIRTSVNDPEELVLNSHYWSSDWFTHCKTHKHVFELVYAQFSFAEVEKLKENAKLC